MASWEDEYRRRQEAAEARERAEEQAGTMASAVTSSDGRILGVKLPEPFPTLWGLFGGRVMGAASETGGEVAGKFVAKVTHSEANGKMAQWAVEKSVPWIPQGIQGVVISKAHAKNRAVVLDPLAPLLAANKNAAKSGMLGSIKEHWDNGYAGNKMVEFALGKVTENTMDSVKMIAIGSVPAVVNNANSYLKKLEIRSENQQKTLDFANKYGNELAGAATLGLQKTLKSVDIKEALPDTALGKVFDLQEMIRRSDLDSPNSVASGSDMATVASQVEDIFQTYQKEQNHRAIPSHRMREVSNMIAEELVSGDLHALSLVNLVGKEKLLNEKKDGIVSSEKIGELLKQETAIFSKNSAITSEDFLKDHSNFTLDDIRSHIQSKNEDERALALTLIPKSVALEAGAKESDIKKAQAHISKKMREGVFTAVIHGLASQPDEQLEDKGLSREAIVFVREHEGAGAESIAHAMQNKSGLQQLQTIASGELFGEESTAWRDVIATGKAAAVTGKGPAANDEAGGAAARKGHAANDEAYKLAANSGHAAKLRAASQNQEAFSK